MRALIGRIFAIAAFLALAGMATRAQAQVRFTNLDRQPVSFASYAYQPYRSSISAGDYNLPAVQEEGFTFSGWGRISPGATVELSPGHYYLEGPNGPIAWNGFARSPGYVSNGPFTTFVPKARWNESVSKLMGAGYRQVAFQEFRNGNYTIAGNAFRFDRRSYNVDFSSRSLKRVNRSFDVPGQVAYFDFSRSDRWARNLSITRRPTAVNIDVTLEGRQTSPFGPREPAYLRGTLNITFTVPN